MTSHLLYPTTLIKLLCSTLPPFLKDEKLYALVIFHFSQTFHRYCISLSKNKIGLKFHNSGTLAATKFRVLRSPFTTYGPLKGTPCAITDLGLYKYICIMCWYLTFDKRVTSNWALVPSSSCNLISVCTTKFFQTILK